MERLKQVDWWIAARAGVWVVYPIVAGVLAVWGLRWVWRAIGG